MTNHQLARIAYQTAIQLQYTQQDAETIAKRALSLANQGTPPARAFDLVRKDMQKQSGYARQIL